MGGNQQALEKAKEMARVDFPSDMQEMVKAIQRGDVVNFKQRLHALKGVSQIMAAEEIVEQVVLMENRTESADPDAIKRDLSELEKRVMEFCQRL
ncbi:MAG: Hpt domain-containing protein [Blastochloris sp.]|nr:Hpt domain-containing protein [Blastochloris sp.]